MEPSDIPAPVREAMGKLTPEQVVAYLRGRAAERMTALDGKPKASDAVLRAYAADCAALLLAAEAVEREEKTGNALRRVDNFLAGTGASPTAVMLQAIRFDLLEALGLPLDAPSTSPSACASCGRDAYSPCHIPGQGKTHEFVAEGGQQG